MKGLKGKTALITGGSRGLGRAITLLFAEYGTNVAINYRADEKAAAEVQVTARQHGVEALLVQADTSHRGQVEAMVQRTIGEFGGIDVLVNNAGIWERNVIDNMSEQALRRTIDTNLYGTFYPIMSVVPHMKERKSGSIINISSTAGQRGEAFHSPYGATKAAVIGLTKSLAPELAGFNIRVNCVAPGWFETDMSREALAEDSESIVRQIPLGRVGRPEELAGAVVFLASDFATFITGEVFNVNGGAVLCG
jgi:3-oxoacyl-[acyl-carrier protein] reductase